MAASKGANKGAEKAKNAAIAGRLSHLRSAKFVTQGFKSNEPTPTISAARKMAGANARLYASLTPTPSIRQR